MINPINKILRRFFCPECGERMGRTAFSNEMFTCEESHVFYRVVRLCEAYSNCRNCKHVGFW